MNILLESFFGQAGKTKGRKDSPAFDFINTGSIETTQSAKYDLETLTGSWSLGGGEPRAYLPYDNITIQNNSSQICRFLPNRNRANAVVCLNRGMRIIRNAGIRSWEVELVNTTEIGTNLIHITVWNE